MTVFQAKPANAIPAAHRCVFPMPTVKAHRRILDANWNKRYAAAHVSCRMSREPVQDGAQATSMLVNYAASDHLIGQYVDAAAACDIQLAEVGIWNSPFYPAPAMAYSEREKCIHQLELADYVQARCCVNVSGAAGEVWHGCYRENFTSCQYEQVVKFVQHLCDTVKSWHTVFTFEPMQWMVPDTPEQYLQLLKDVDRPAFGVHLDPVNFIKDP